MRKSILFLFAIVCAAFMAAQEQLPKWEKGYLDIHHINTGRGSCAMSHPCSNRSTCSPKRDLPTPSPAAA